MGDRNQRAFPALRYRDGVAAVAWLTTVAGFEKKLVVPGPGGQVAHAELSFGGDTVLLGSGKHGDDNPWDRVAQGTYILVDDVDGHHARARAAGADIVMALHDTDYGSRDYSVRDPEGHLWSFGTYRPKD